MNVMDTVYHRTVSICCDVKNRDQFAVRLMRYVE